MVGWQARGVWCRGVRARRGGGDGEVWVTVRGHQQDDHYRQLWTMLAVNYGSKNKSYKSKGWNKYGIHEGRNVFENNQVQKYSKLKQIPGRGLLNIKHQ